MRSTFGTGDCSLLCINSSQEAPFKHQDNPWASYITDSSSSPTQDVGCFLNMDDIDEIKVLMQDLSSKHIIPNMEQTIRILNQQVSATRKGFRNQIKNLWWRKGKEDGADSLNGPSYNFNSIESQIRVLGDYAFMLRDYELALSNYRLISTDYKIDKAWKRYAGVQKLGSLGQLNATRCGLWWIEMLKARDQYKEAATDILHSAVMLEQASYCYLLSKPSMLRKYGFHLVLSGEQYKKCDQIKHAIRTYRCALSVFKGTTWSYINDHVHFHIGQWYASLGMYDVAVKHMTEILCCSHQSKTTQELFLGDFLHIVEKTGRTFEVTKLQLPVINISTLRVIYEDHRTFGSPSSHSDTSEEVVEGQSRKIHQAYERKRGRTGWAQGMTWELLGAETHILSGFAVEALFCDTINSFNRDYGGLCANIREALWHSLEEEMLPSFSAAKTNWLELQSKLILKKHSQNVCVAGEAVKVTIEFKNPLQISIPISSVTLVCKYSASTDEVISNENESSMEKDNKVGHFRNMSSDNSSFMVSEVDFLLGGGETTMNGPRLLPWKMKINVPFGKVKMKLSDDGFGIESICTVYLTAELPVGRGARLERLVWDFWERPNCPGHIQLSATPREEGTLEIIGVRWKLSGTIVGFYNFELGLPKKNILKRRKTKDLPNEKFKFMVIKSIPKLQGSIHPLPGKAYAGDLRQLVLELRNPSEFPVKNLKMKISHPRFLIIGKQENMMSEFPACLRKKTDSVQSVIHDNPNITTGTVFLFPEGTSVQGDTPFLWPLWFRAAVPGDISLCMSIYYEIGDVSSIIKYRTLRLHYNVQVLPSLDVSFQICPFRSRLEEFLVRLDVVNKTSSESFQVCQLSSVGHQWEISLVEAPDSIFPLQSLMAGFEHECGRRFAGWVRYTILAVERRFASEVEIPVFCSLHVHGFVRGKEKGFCVRGEGFCCRLESKSRRLSTFGDDVSTSPVKSDAILVPQSIKDIVYDVNSAPLVNFHHYERLQQEVSYKGDLNTVDFVLIYRPFRSSDDPDFSTSSSVMSHHACHFSTASTGPISWLVDGPQTMHHDFSASFCEINMKMHIHNSSGGTTFVRIDTLDSDGNSGQINSVNVVQSATTDNQAGWHDIAPVNELKVASNALETQPGKALSLESASSYIWSGSSSTHLHIEAMSSVEIPLQICVFSPGTYDLSNYVLNWKLPSNGQGDSDEKRQQSGQCQGYKYYLTVLQST
ncbi:hypothetical protein V8G54_019443 [Vigna mungo]|uniref:Trafficking protein particle complex subunit 8 n=1 Tax=Vigna mungo TaxID=3915 RepID=A0AAQ3NBM4_VIGMU